MRISIADEENMANPLWKVNICPMKFRQKIVPLKKLQAGVSLAVPKKAENAREQWVQSNPPPRPGQKIWQLILDPPTGIWQFFQSELNLPPPPPRLTFPPSRIFHCK